LYDCGLTDIVGTDNTPEMIRVAKNINPELAFERSDIIWLKYPDNFFGSVVASHCCK
ncbi:MAG: methyltransferase domain-containing protein, partial [Segetibacter sp.]|nr:methyltransferase domain-containing protein [Segetibacter sp.]